jgi:PAS domain S-box-containing protein
MPQPPGSPELDLEMAALKERYAGLRQAAAMPGADAGAVLEAAFAELDAAVDVLGAMRAGPVPAAAQAGGAGPEALLAERRLLRAVFEDAPVPMFLLGPDATVQRVNTRASELLGSGSGYAVGKLFTAFVDLPSRAVVQSQLATVVRTGRTRRIPCRLLRPEGPAAAVLTAGVARTRGDGDQVVLVASEGPAGGPEVPD